jgi:hypothetical protein
MFLVNYCLNLRVDENPSRDPHASTVLQVPQPEGAPQSHSIDDEDLLNY